LGNKSRLNNSIKVNTLTLLETWRACFFTVVIGYSYSYGYYYSNDLVQSLESLKNLFTVYYSIF